MPMPKPNEVERLHPDICQREIPQSEVGVSEADDYILHYCGTDYFARHAKQLRDSEGSSD